MQQKLLIVILFLAVALMFIGLTPIHGEAEIYDSVIRLHVLANSDSEEDQALKLQVRDAVLAYTSPLLANCADQDEARVLLDANRDAIRAVAEEVIAAAGRQDAVTVMLGEESYPRKSYDSICFPGGSYLSLRVCIGAAEGQNWWCCLFPPLCLGAATVSSEAAEESFVSVGLTPSQYKIITETDKPVYKIRFKILELFGG